MITIREAKITFLWGSCFADHLWNDVAADPAPWRKPAYVVEFNELRGGGQPGPYDLAWYPSQKSAFWRSYLGGQAPGEVRGPDAWDALVPLRLLTWLPSVVTDQNERVVIDTYGHELGVVIAMTVQPFKRAAATMDQWVERLRSLRSDEVFTVSDGTSTAQVDVTGVLQMLARTTRREGYGGGGSSVDSREPLTIANVLQADGGSPGVPVDATLQRHLHAVTAWPDDWRGCPLPVLAQPSPLLRQRSDTVLPNDAIYAASRGVAVWRPGLFARHPAGPGRRKHTLSCLGHNLAACAAQAEYFRLASLAWVAQPRLRDRLESARIRAIGHRIAALVAGASTTYRSDYARHLLSERNSREQVNAVLTLAGAPCIP